jgi:putative toxin-antitoxin system antitoxin component (TIGR02293 family)
MAEAPMVALARKLEDPPVFHYTDIERGIPAASVPGLTAHGLTRADIRRVIPDRTLQRRIAGGDALKPEEADAIARLLRVVAAARDCFDDDANADHWLRAPNPALGGRVPMDLAHLDAGAREVEAILGRIAHGVYS